MTPCVNMSPAASREPGQKLSRRHRPAAFGLQLGDRQDAVAGRDVKPIASWLRESFPAARRDRRSRFAATRSRRSADCSSERRHGVERNRIKRRPRWYVKACGQGCSPRIRLWMASRRPRPVDRAILAHQPVRVCRQRLVLRHLRHRTRRRARRRPRRATARRCRARSRSTSSLVSSGPIGRRAVASIGPASSAFTTRMIVTPVSRSPLIDRAVHRRRAAIAGQQRCVHVDQPQARRWRGSARSGSSRTRRRRRGRRRARSAPPESRRRSCARAAAPGCRPRAPAP